MGREQHPTIINISIHAPREGSDPSWWVSLPSCCVNFYPRSPRGERQAFCGPQQGSGDISIHAPREGSDGQKSTSKDWTRSFLSTLPARGATKADECRARLEAFLSTLPARGATLCSASDTFSDRFLSTLPARGATDAQKGLTLPTDISIHAPREGSDAEPGTAGPANRNFYPRSPRGERPHGSSRTKHSPFYFYPRSPRGERRHPGVAGHTGVAISIHAPREGSDLGYTFLIGAMVAISIHAPREGSDDSVYAQYLWAIGISIHAPREGSDGIMIFGWTG